MGRGFIARAGVQARSSHIRKKRGLQRWVVSKGSVSVPDWTRLRGSVPGSLASLRNLSVAFSGACLNMPDLSELTEGKKAYIIIFLLELREIPKYQMHYICSHN